MAELLPILIACEYSDTVASAFRAFGFDAYSCAAMAQQWGDHILRVKAATRTFVALQLEQAA